MKQRAECRVRSAAKIGALALIAAAVLPLSSELRTLNAAYAAIPITTDSRIKTFVYNENEVFNIVTHYGYQSNIELGENEEIMTVSIGDRVGWQIVPAGRRIFIRAMEDRAHTNMTVVTNKRAYQFDIREAGQAALMPGEELVYVVRFYYPDEPGQTPPPPIVSASAMAPPPPPMAAASAPMNVPLQASPMTQAPAFSAPAPITAPRAMNYNYTFSGASAAAPLKIYDDGRATYFKLPTSGQMPAISVLTASGQEMPIAASNTSEGMIMVNVVAPRFTISSGGARVVVYNESMPGV